MQEHYLDNAATTRPLPEVVSLIQETLLGPYGNPSSLHRKGQEAEHVMQSAREKIAKVLHTEPSSVVFTSCATESIYTALQAALLKNRRLSLHVLLPRGEHAATSGALQALSSYASLFGREIEMEYLQNLPDGSVSLSDLESKLREDTALVTSIHVNNETGVIQPIEKMGALIRSKSPKALFHVDATQSFSKYELDLSRTEIDFLSASAHKIHGPKGIGLLFQRRGLSMTPLLRGGGQERGLRSGTENVAYIAGFGLAAQRMEEQRSVWEDHCRSLKQEAVRLLQESFPDISVNGPSVAEGAAHIVNLRIPKVRSEVLLHALEDKGIFISSGSACASNHPEEKSPALSALGLSTAAMEESVRLSFSLENTTEDVKALRDAMTSLIPMLRRFT